MAQTTIRRGREEFPRTVESVGELPAAVFGKLRQHHATPDLQKIIVIPPQKFPVLHKTWRQLLSFGWRWTPYRLMYFGDEHILIIEEADANPPHAIVIPVLGIIAVQIDEILLYTYLELSWVKDNRVESLSAEFNTVGLSMIERRLQKVRQIITEHSLAHAPAAPEPISTRHLPLKFQNYARMSLMAGEEIRFAVHQPALRQPGKLFLPTRGPNRALVLTGQNLLVLEDARPSMSTKYRMNRMIYPRARITGAQIEAGPELDWLRLSVGEPAARLDTGFPLSKSHSGELQWALDNWFLCETPHG